MRLGGSVAAWLAIGVLAAGAATAEPTTNYRGLGFTLSYPASWRRSEAREGWLTLAAPTPDEPSGALVAVHLIGEAGGVEAEVQRWAKTAPAVSRRTLHRADAPAHACRDIEAFMVRRQVGGRAMVATDYVCVIDGRLFRMRAEVPAAERDRARIEAAALEMMRSLRVRN